MALCVFSQKPGSQVRRGIGTDRWHLQHTAEMSGLSGTRKRRAGYRSGRVTRCVSACVFGMYIGCVVCIAVQAAPKPPKKEEACFCRVGTRSRPHQTNWDEAHDIMAGNA